jgi:hypothetical protein
MFDPTAAGNVTVDRHSGVAGGHEYVISAYDQKSGTFRMDNSWGTSWGIKGSAWLLESDMQWLLSQDGDITVPASAPVPSPPPSPTPSPVPGLDPRLVRVAALMGEWAHDNGVA